jgi:hypothetical protein
MRVQIPAYTDRWMMGDRYGDVVKVARQKRRPTDAIDQMVEVAHVKLDISGKTLRFLLADCTEV